MLGITYSPQNYHDHQQILSKLRENNENDMTSAVWAVIVFGPRVWPLSARRHYVLHVCTACCSTQTVHKPIYTSSVKQTTGIMSLLSYYIHYGSRASFMLFTSTNLFTEVHRMQAVNENTYIQISISKKWHSTGLKRISNDIFLQT